MDSPAEDRSSSFRRARGALKLLALVAAVGAGMVGLYRLLDSTALDVLRYRFDFGPVVLVLLILNVAALLGGLALHRAYRSIRRDWRAGDADDEED